MKKIILYLLLVVPCVLFLHTSAADIENSGYTLSELLAYAHDHPVVVSAGIGLAIAIAGAHSMRPSGRQKVIDYVKVLVAKPKLSDTEKQQIERIIRRPKQNDYTAYDDKYGSILLPNELGLTIKIQPSVFAKALAAVLYPNYQDQIAFYDLFNNKYENKYELDNAFSSEDQEVLNWYAERVIKNKLSNIKLLTVSLSGVAGCAVAAIAYLLLSQA